MDQDLSYLEGVPQLDERTLRRIASGMLTPDERLDACDTIYEIAKEIRRRRPPGHRELLRHNGNWPTPELKSEIRDLVRCGWPKREVARLHDVPVELARKIVAEGDDRRRCTRCGGLLAEWPGRLPQRARPMLDALVAAWPAALTNQQWGLAAGKRTTGRWASTRTLLAEAGLAEWLPRRMAWRATPLAVLGCVACAAAAHAGRRRDRTGKPTVGPSEGACGA